MSSSTPETTRHGEAGGSSSDDASDPAFRNSVLVFAALGDKTRLDLVARLCAGGPLSITRLTAGADVTRQALTALCEAALRGCGGQP